MLKQPKQTRVEVLLSFRFAGEEVTPGTIATYDTPFAVELISNQKARRAPDESVAEPEPQKPARKAGRSNT
jgi:hypothetical protein